MDYITEFQIIASPLDTERFSQIDATVREREISHVLLEREYDDQTGYWFSDYDLLHDYEDDVLAISKQFPDVHFELNSKGDNGNNACSKYYLAGKTCRSGSFSIIWPFIESDLYDPEKSIKGTTDPYARFTQLDVMLYRSMQSLVNKTDWDFPWNPSLITDVRCLMAEYLQNKGHSIRWHASAPSTSKSPACEEDPSQVVAYERFRLQWMLDHGYTLTDLIRGLEALRAEGAGKDGIHELFSEWERSCGFGSALWPCYREYLACEGIDSASRKEG